VIKYLTPTLLIVYGKAGLVQVAYKMLPQSHFVTLK